MLQGVRWMDDDGSKINSFRDPWLRRAGSCRLVTTQLSVVHYTGSLILSHGIWNRNLIDDIYLPVDKKVLNLILSLFSITKNP